MAERQCPFHSQHGGIGLSEVAAIVRVGDRVRFQLAVNQLAESVRTMEHDLDAARGQVLAFLAIALSAVLELGGHSSNHRFLLDAARRLDGQSTLEEVHQCARELATSLCEPFFERVSVNDDLIDRAIRYLDANYSKTIEDDDLARKLGLSTSHFRFLFRQATGHPFQKYLMSLRLEKARLMLVEETSNVGEVAASVGFTNCTTFSRAFVRRFSVAPSDLRKSRFKSSRP